jgi:hypothetical protein
VTDAGLARRRYQELQRRARELGQPTWELLELYALEGFLARLATSPHRSTLVLKGGMLLAAFELRRPTRDVDVHAQQLVGDVEVVRDVVAEVAAIDVADGLDYDTSTAEAELIREQDIYSGVRVSLPARLATGEMKLQVDVNVGDPIRPAPIDVEVPRILDDSPIGLRGYPMVMVLAEKIVTAVQRGTANTRWRDFADIYLLSRRREVVGQELQEALRAVAGHRGVELRALDRVLEGYVAIAQERWARWQATNLAGRVPEQFDEILDHVVDLADPALAGEVGDANWSPVELAWQ